jgi:hypothetical protein
MPSARSRLANRTVDRNHRVLIDKAASVDGTVKIFKMDPTRVAELNRMAARILKRQRVGGGRKNRHRNIAA